MVYIINHINSAMFNCNYFLQRKSTIFLYTYIFLGYINLEAATTFGVFYITKTRNILKIKLFDYYYVYTYKSLYERFVTVYLNKYRYKNLYSLIVNYLSFIGIIPITYYKSNSKLTFWYYHAQIIYNFILVMVKYIKFFILNSVCTVTRYISYKDKSYVSVIDKSNIGANKSLSALYVNFLNTKNNVDFKIINSSSLLQSHESVNNLFISVLRYNRFFNKTKFSRNRQVVFSIVQFGLFLNILFILLGSSVYYQITPDISYFNITIFFCIFIQINF